MRCVRLSFVATSLLLTLYEGGSIRADGAGSAEPTTAVSNVSYTMGAFGASKCTARLTWAWSPVKVDGAGTKTKTTIPLYSDEVTRSVKTCTFKNQQSGLALGEWTVTITLAGSDTLQCKTTLKAGQNDLAFPDCTEP